MPYIVPFSTYYVVRWPLLSCPYCRFRMLHRQYLIKLYSPYFLAETSITAHTFLMCLAPQPILPCSTRLVRTYFIGATSSTGCTFCAWLHKLYFLYLAPQAVLSFCAWLHRPYFCTWIDRPYFLFYLAPQTIISVPGYTGRTFVL